MTKREFVADVLRQYTSLPHTPDQARKNDRRLAAELFDQKAPRETISAAFLIAIVRRSVRPASEPPLDPIRSLAYFRPLIQQLISNPVADVYVDYITYRYQQILADPESATRVPQLPQV